MTDVEEAPWFSASFYVINVISRDVMWIRVKMQEYRSTMVCFSVQKFDGSRGRCLNTRAHLYSSTVLKARSH